MTTTPAPIRRTGVTLAAAAVLVVGLLASPATAGRTAPELTGEAALELAERLGGRSAGAYLDEGAGRLVVTVTDEATARTVRSAGGVARVVERGAADLDRVTAALARSAAVAGTSWYADPVSNQVVISVDDTVTGTRLALVEAVAARFGAAARVERLPGVLETTAAGGDPIFSSGSRCSLGFNVLDAANRPMFLTAGHCTNNRVFWTIDGVANAATTVASSFPGNDYGLVRWDNPNASRPGAVNMYNGTTRDISSSANPYVGQTVSKSGSTTGLTTGPVTGTNVTVNYSSGTVSGLFQSNMCTEGGDSGGAVFANNTALGLHSGSNRAACRAYHQPVTEALSAYNARVY